MADWMDWDDWVTYECIDCGHFVPLIDWCRAFEVCTWCCHQCYEDEKAEREV